jgi:phage terminase small subunit
VKRRPAPPKGLPVAGRRVWREVVGDLPESMEFTANELTLLAAAARQADDVAALEAVVKRDGVTVVGSAGQPRVHPAVAEARLGRAVLARLLGDLRVDTQDVTAATAASRRAQRAADARWSEHRARRALRSA